MIITSKDIVFWCTYKIISYISLVLLLEYIRIGIRIIPKNKKLMISHSHK